MALSGVTREDTAQKAARRVRALYEALELAVIAAVADAVLAVVSGALTEAQAGRRLRLTVLAAFAVTASQVRAVIAAAARETRSDVQRVIAEDLGPFAPVLPVVPLAPFPRLTGDLHQAELAALNWAERTFREILAGLRQRYPVQPSQPVQQQQGKRARLAAPGLLAVAQSLLTAAAAAGVTGLVTSAGALWGLAAYAAMVTRAAVARAHVAMQLRALEAARVDLVLVVRSSPRPPCPKCAPWVGKVLSVTGLTSGQATVTDAAGKIRTAQIAGTVAQARASGLLHFACRDSLAPFANGARVMPPPYEHGPQWLARQEAAYHAEQARRRTERERWRADRVAAAGITPQARTRARRQRRALG